MQYDRIKGRALSMKLNWRKCYEDFKSKQCCIAEYHKKYFQSFLCSEGFSDYVLCEKTLHYHFKKFIKEQKTKDELSNNTTIAPNTQDTNKSQAPLQEFVSVYDLQDLLPKKQFSNQATFPHVASAHEKTDKEKLIQNTQASSFHQCPLTLEWNGIRITYDTNDPHREALSLLLNLRKNTEVGDVH